MNVLAIIPARGGSKGVPRKNLREVGGKPLLAWSIEAARRSRLVDNLVVSSDDEEILAVAENELIGLPLASGRTAQKSLMLRRPADLATDVATTDSVLVHALKDANERAAPFGYSYDLVVLLQPTVPVRAPWLVDACIERFLAAQARPYGAAPNALLTANKLHFVWHRWKEYSPWMSNSIARPRRQDLPQSDLRWAEDGSVYVTRAEQLLGKGRRLVEPIEVYETERTIDVDTELDLVIADLMLRTQPPVEIPIKAAALSEGCCVRVSARGPVHAVARELANPTGGI